MRPASIGIIGHGDFGRFLETLAQRFVPEATIRIYARRQEPDQVRFFSLADVAGCQVVLLAVPISQYETTLTSIVPLLGSDTTLVDVATVKYHTARLLRSHADQVRYISTHPMFGPFSYEKKGGDVGGFRLVVTEHNLEEALVSQVIAWLEGLGLVVLRMTPDQHDQLLAETLFLTHYIGQIVTVGNFGRTDIDTVSFGFLMDAVESVQGDTALFRDVYRFNPYCEAVLKRFEQAEKNVHEQFLKTN